MSQRPAVAAQRCLILEHPMATPTHRSTSVLLTLVLFQFAGKDEPVAGTTPFLATNPNFCWFPRRHHAAAAQTDVSRSYPWSRNSQDQILHEHLMCLNSLAILGWFPLLTMIPVRENSEVVMKFTQMNDTSITLWLFNIAMENCPFIDGLPIKNGDVPWLFNK